MRLRWWRATSAGHVLPVLLALALPGVARADAFRVISQHYHIAGTLYYWDPVTGIPSVYSFDESAEHPLMKYVGWPAPNHDYVDVYTHASGTVLPGLALTLAESFDVNETLGNSGLIEASARITFQPYVRTFSLTSWCTYFGFAGLYDETAGQWLFAFRQLQGASLAYDISSPFTGIFLLDPSHTYSIYSEVSGYQSNARTGVSLTLEAKAVPESSSALLLGIALTGLAGTGRLRSARSPLHAIAAPRSARSSRRIDR